MSNIPERLIDDESRKHLQERFQNEMKNDVTVDLFAGSDNADYVEFTEKVPASRFDGSVFTVKTGKVKDMGLFNFRLLLRSIIRLSQKHKINKIKINFDDLYKMAEEASAKYMAEGDEFGKSDMAEMLGYELEIANYNFNKYKTKYTQNYYYQNCYYNFSFHIFILFVLVISYNLLHLTSHFHSLHFSTTPPPPQHLYHLK